MEAASLPEQLTSLSYLIQTTSFRDNTAFYISHYDVRNSYKEKPLLYFLLEIIKTI